MAGLTDSNLKEIDKLYLKLVSNGSRLKIYSPLFSGCYMMFASLDKELLEGRRSEVYAQFVKDRPFSERQ